jgi:hypothetical protein
MQTETRAATDSTSEVLGWTIHTYETKAKNLESFVHSAAKQTKS